jgi:hypothetical protein
MRDLIGFVVFGLIVFFVVGETVGWNVGFAGQTPVFVYKRDGEAVAERRTRNRSDMPVAIDGRVRNGEVEVRIVYQDTGSFQTNEGAEPPVQIFDETYREGQRIALDRTFDQGRGEYRVELIFRNGTGVFRIDLPGNTEL